MITYWYWVSIPSKKSRTLILIGAGVSFKIPVVDSDDEVASFLLCFLGLME